MTNIEIKRAHTLPADIERTSMEIITQELQTRGFVCQADGADVIKRVIHTTADFDYADNLRFTPGAVENGVAVLLRKATIITDTNMTKAGVSKPSLQRLNGAIQCFMTDETVASAAKENGTTRAVAAMEKAAREYPNAIFAIGNAPTALLCIVELIRKGLRPALVIGVPVGFVNVEESKEMLWKVCREYHLPAIVAMGRKGGSTVAAAICNALLYTAANTLDPAARGWQ